MWYWSNSRTSHLGCQGLLRMDIWDVEEYLCKIEFVMSLKEEISEKSWWEMLYAKVTQMFMMCNAKLFA